MTHLAFDFSDHFAYLNEMLRRQNVAHGEKKKLSEFVGIQPAFLSQVLSKKICLSLEQADLVSAYFKHSTEEAHFFLLLVSKDRAGTASLSKYYKNQIAVVLKTREKVVEVLGKKEQISEVSKGIYYSTWMYAAIHIACTVPQLRNRITLSEHFNIPVEIVDKVLKFLLEIGLITQEGVQFITTKNWIRLTQESPFIFNHHRNWREQAIANIPFQTEDDLHFSGVYSLDVATAKKIKKEFLQFMQLQVKQIEVAPEEQIYILGLDFFKK